MISHFLEHGQKEGYKNGTYISQRNAYLILKNANQFFYVGVDQDSTLITTYFTKTLTKTAMALLGLI